MKDKKLLKKKKAIKAKMIDENASVSSDLKSSGQEENDYYENEIRKKLVDRENEFEENDFDFLTNQKQEIEADQSQETENNEQSVPAELLDKNLMKLYKTIADKKGPFENFYKCFKMILLFYFSQKEKTKAISRDHPSINYILKCQTLLPQIEKLEKQKMTQTSNVSLVKNQSTQYKIKPDSKEPLLITNDMLKNKGIAKRRSTKKKSMIPKLKQKKRFNAAKQKIVSKGHRTKKIGKVYDGEKRGIKASINRAINI